MVKSKNFFARKASVVKEKKKIQNLKQQKTQIHRQMKALQDMYNIPDNFVNYIPMSASIVTPHKEFVPDYSLELSKMKSNIRNEYDGFTEELSKIHSSIKESEINMILAKIKIMENELNNWT